MADTLDIASLIPKRDTVDFGRGAEYELLHGDELSGLDWAYLANLQGRAQKLVDAALEDGDADAQAARLQELDPLLNQTLQYVMPDAPAEALVALPVPTKQGILDWWTEQRHKAAEADPNAEGQD